MNKNEMTLEGRLIGFDRPTTKEAKDEFQREEVRHIYQQAMEGLGIDVAGRIETLGSMGNEVISFVYEQVKAILDAKGKLEYSVTDLEVVAEILTNQLNLLRNIQHKVNRSKEAVEFIWSKRGLTELDSQDNTDVRGEYYILNDSLFQKLDAMLQEAITSTQGSMRVLVNQDPGLAYWLGEVDKEVTVDAIPEMPAWIRDIIGKLEPELAYKVVMALLVIFLYALAYNNKGIVVENVAALLEGDYANSLEGFDMARNSLADLAGILETDFGSLQGIIDANYDFQNYFNQKEDNVFNREGDDGIQNDEEEDEETNVEESGVSINSDEISNRRPEIVNVIATINGTRYRLQFQRVDLISLVYSNRPLLPEGLNIPPRRAAALQDPTQFGLGTNGRGGLFITFGEGAHTGESQGTPILELNIEAAVDNAVAADPELNSRGVIPIDSAHFDENDVASVEPITADNQEEGQEEVGVEEEASAPEGTLLRSGNVYNSEGERIGSVNEGDTVKVLGFYPEMTVNRFGMLIEGFAEVELEDGTVGFVEAAAITMIAPEQEEAEEEVAVEEEAPIFGRIITETANVRARTSTNSSVLHTFEEGTQVNVMGISTDGEWYAVQFLLGEQLEGGWIFAELMTVEPADLANLETVTQEQVDAVGQQPEAEAGVVEVDTPEEETVDPRETQAPEPTEPPLVEEEDEVTLNGVVYPLTATPEGARGYLNVSERNLLNTSGEFLPEWSHLAEMLAQQNLRMETRANGDCFVINGSVAAPLLFEIQGEVVVAFNNQGGVMFRAEKAANTADETPDGDEAASDIPETITHNGREIRVLAETDIAEIDGVVLNWGWNDVEMPESGSFREAAHASSENGVVRSTAFVRGIYLYTDGGQMEVFIPDGQGGGGTVRMAALFPHRADITLRGDEFSMASDIPELTEGQIVVFEVFPAEDNPSMNVPAAMAQQNGEDSEETVANPTDLEGDDFIATLHFIHRED